MKSAEWRLNWRDNHIAQKLWYSQHSQIKTEHCVSFQRSLSTLKLILCVIYLASEKYTVSYAYFTRWKNQRIGCFGAPEAWRLATDVAYFQVHIWVPVPAAKPDFSTGRRGSELTRIGTHRSFGEWSQQIPTVKQCRRCLTQTGIQHNLITNGSQSRACFCGALFPIRGMMMIALV